MDRADFIRIVSTQPDNLSQYPVIQLVVQSSTFFLWHLLTTHSKNMLRLQTLDVQMQDIGTTIACLRSSFLGGSYLYWIQGHESLLSKKAKVFAEFLKNYSAPHSLLLVTKKAYKVSPAAVTVVFDGALSRGFALQLASLFDVKNKRWVSQLPSSISVNEACMLLYYSMLGGEEYRSSRWGLHLVSTPPSLFTLSQYLFAKQSSAFFSLWSTLHPWYVPQFWVSFWSDQLWRAYFYIRYMRAQQNDQAKQFARRLPFSFLNKDWRLYSPEEIERMHACLYEADYLSKNGVSSLGLELLYSRFFLSH